MEIQIRALVIISPKPGQCLDLKEAAAEVTATVSSIPGHERVTRTLIPSNDTGIQMRNAKEVN